MSKEKPIREIFRQAIDIYGIDQQSTCAIEELSELIHALTGMKRNNYSCLPPQIDNLEEEIADVELMLEQVKFMFNIKPEAIEGIKKRKLLRLKLRMERVK